MLPSDPVESSLSRVRACLRSDPFLRLMLRRKPTRIELKPDDRDEYFAHKEQKPPADSKDKPSDKEVRIGIAKPR